MNLSITFHFKKVFWVFQFKLNRTKVVWNIFQHSYYWSHLLISSAMGLMLHFKETMKRILWWIRKKTITVQYKNYMQSAEGHRGRGIRLWLGRLIGRSVGLCRWWVPFWTCYVWGNSKWRCPADHHVDTEVWSSVEKHRFVSHQNLNGNQKKG